MSKYSVYIHIPFCQHRCAYCDFNTYAGLMELIPDYCAALSQEIKYLAHVVGRMLPVHTIYFGGGTPSLLPANRIENILSTLWECFAIDVEVEITLEANPGTLKLDYLRSLRLLGVNRISLGVQSFNIEELKMLEREHGPEEVIQAVKYSRQAGFDNLSLDLIYGLPGQELRVWRKNVEFALVLQPEHLSLYCLSLEHGTPMASWAARGLLPDIDPDLAADMVEWVIERLAQDGFVQYEISNWARPRGDGTLHECRHNLQYWRSEPYLGFGAGAHGFADHVRTANVLSPHSYIKRCLLDHDDHEIPLGREPAFPWTPATQTAQRLDRRTEIGETMMMGLRLTRLGVNRQEFYSRFGADLEDVYGAEIADLVKVGLLEWEGGDQKRLRLTPKGRMLGNQVFMRFI